MFTLVQPALRYLGKLRFSPVSVKEAWQFSDAQQKLEIEMQNEAGQITNRYIKGDERSFLPLLHIRFLRSAVIMRRFSARS